MTPRRPRLIARALVRCSVLASLVGPAAVAFAALPPPFTNLSAALKAPFEAENRGAYPVRITAAITYRVPAQFADSRPWWFAQDETAGTIVVSTNRALKPAPGDRVEIVGSVVRGNTAPYVVADEIVTVATHALPDPSPATAKQLAAGELAHRQVTVRGIIRDAAVLNDALQLQVSGGRQSFTVVGSPLRHLRPQADWLDAEVELMGVSWPQYNSRGTPSKFALHLTDSNGLRFIPSGTGQLFEGEKMSLAQIKEKFSALRTSDQRVLTEGTVTHVTSSRVAHVEEGGVAMRLNLYRPMAHDGRTNSALLPRPRPPQLKVGDRVQVRGLPTSPVAGITVLTDADCRVLDSGPRPAPVRMSIARMMEGSHGDRLVKVGGRLARIEPLDTPGYPTTTFYLEAEGYQFEAYLVGENVTPEKFFPGDYVEVVGVSQVFAEHRSRGRKNMILIGSVDDLTLAAAPSFWTARWFQIALMGGGAATAVWLVWIGALRRQVRRQTGELRAANAALRVKVEERDRSDAVQKALYAISEAIHSADDLPSLYARIHEIIGSLMPARNFYIALHDPATDMVSFPYHRDEMDPPPAPRKTRRGMTEYVLRSGRAALADLGEIERLKAAGEYVQSGAPAKIWLGVPLVVGGKPFGVMAVQDHHDARAYGEEEKQILSFVAGQTALAIERKRAEADLRVALAAEKELGELKSSFVSMVSHEFRTPLEVVLSSSNILDRYFDRLPADKRKAQLRAIRKSVRRMNDLVEDVLMLGKFDAGRMTLAPTPVDLAVLCRRAVEDVATAMDGEGRIRVEVSPEVNGDAVADEALLSHILTNLLGNALKYSPRESAVDFVIARRGIEAEFIVRDRGCGIPAADLPHLFTAFRRGGNVGQKSGSGLGLAIVKRCVDLHGGTVRCESVENGGTTFTVTLPVFEGTAFFRKPAAASAETKS